ncbi:MAG TPA: homoserine dehydrogenase [Patescibacteria group bacterium]|nr:homoserine dehydrogenase [Patescibacteria group bacterium]
MSTRASLRVAVLGAGTVGGSVVRAFLERPEKLAPFDGARLVLAGVAEKDFARAAALGVPPEIVTDAPAHLVADPEIDIVVELMGGDEPAHTLVAAALGAGKAVVTANKHMVAHHGPELEAIARRTGAALRFEAAVGGGIPILAPLAADLALNSVTRVRGIVNGTTNFILTSMGEFGRSYEEVLAEAQANGYAEADPRGDVEGDDAVNKLVILVRLAFGHWLEPAGILRTAPSVRGWGKPGITGVTSKEMGGAGLLGLGIKLLAVAEPGPDGTIGATVLPTAVPRHGALGGTDGVLNRIEIRANPVGDIAFSGPGAGGDATSSAVVGDLLAIARHGSSTWAGLPPAADAPVADGDRDPLAAPRPWFAFLPGIAPGGVELGETAAIAGFEGGTVVRTGPLPPERVRAALAPLLPEDVDVPLYPVTD